MSRNATKPIQMAGAQDVQVNVIRDSAGTHATPNLFFEQLQAAGINVLEFNPINPLAAKKIGL